MRRAALWCAAGLAAALALGLWTAHLVPAPPSRVLSRPAGAPLTLPSPALPQGAVAVNEAGADELDALPGVEADHRPAHRLRNVKNGPFFFPEDLLNVKGIGEKDAGQKLLSTFACHDGGDACAIRYCFWTPRSGTASRPPA